MVLVGGNGWKNQELLKRISKLVSLGEVIHLGHVANADLPYIYAGAASCIFIPHYEGFGLPVLETMASGVPIVASHIAPIKEIVGKNQKMLVDPDDIAVISAKLNRTLTDTHWRDKMIAYGIARAKAFTWQGCVDKTVSVYKRVMCTT